ncbi:DUF456 domain-containing protein [Jiulongibacter sediminis]|uniref:DUF456 domain-containing protein n=1 Tax=Jiulongibacter sediminis TaxID=1605367 RepID=A0A0P7BY14_9BACT|nr:DUF456 domain-containing protein [Jiulongibacter sediminis]KPM49727.1 hypothetical protein AFM12_03855 [Jiulongibacter sediminis]TBX26764.1 hypothetical protein TK44_03860 [Jiulongibacter sediminis]
MDIALLVISIICLIIGLAGSVLPLPGPPLSFAGIIALHYSKYADFSQDLLFGLGAATVIITLLDYYVPIWGTKKFGGTKAGMRGSTAGLIIGMFFGPFGIFIGAFLGALLGEYLMGDKQNALKAAIGSFAGFAAGIAMKLVLCGVMIFYAVDAIW